MQLPRENVQDYPRPPRLEAVPQELRLRLAGIPVAQTCRAMRVLETHHAPTYYLPPDDVIADLVPTPGTSFCEWKGQAQYWTVRAGAGEAPRAAWSYRSPTASFAAIAGWISFYAAPFDAWVGEAKVRPQPGSFYGGWVTDNLDGLIKGGPGTLGW